MLRNSSIAFKLILLVSLAGMVILGILFGYNYTYTSSIILKNLETNAENLALSTVNRIDAVLNPVEKIPESLAAFLECSELNEKGLLTHLRATVVNNPVVYGGTVAFEPYFFNRDSLYYSPYYYKEGSDVKLTWLGGETYKYHYWDWYIVPAELRKPIWSEPYFDEGGGEILMSTYSVPLYKTVKGERKFIGIVTADISLSWLQEFVDQIRILDSGYGFLISKFGTIVTHPDQEKILNETIFSIAEAQDDSSLRTIGRKMIKGESGFVEISSLTGGKRSYMYYAPMRSSGWSLGVLFPEDELMADVKHLSNTLLFLGILGLVVLAIAVAVIVNGIIGPLRILARASENVGEGNLDISLPPIKYHDEVGRLSASFNQMMKSLNDYINKLTEATVAKERIESELNVAHNIQLSIIPKIFPAFPDKSEFDIYANLNPARQVGGDYYDFFFIDNDNLCFTIGDVSGKAVPASLYMAVTRTLFRAKMVHGLSTAQVMSRANRDLCMGDDNSMFVTIFLGVLNIKTGVVEYCNAGHDQPIIIHSDGNIELLGKPDGLVAGMFEEFEYKCNYHTLKKGDTLLLFTDGVTEAMDKSDNMYTEERLLEFAKGCAGKNATEITNAVKNEIVEFSNGAEQSDDITILTLKYQGENAA